MIPLTIPNQAPPRRPHHPAPAPVDQIDWAHGTADQAGSRWFHKRARLARDTVGRDVRVCVDVAVA